VTGAADVEELAELGQFHQSAARDLYGLATDVRQRIAALTLAGLEAYGITTRAVTDEGDALASALFADQRALVAAALRVESQLSAVEAAGGSPLTTGSEANLWWFSMGKQAAAPDATNPVLDARIVASAEQWVGEPYGWGGGHGALLAPHSAPVDCSGLVEQVYGANGIDLHGGTAQSLYDLSRPVADLAAAQPGDLVFYGGPTSIHHVAIYIGSGEMIEAPHTGATVHVTPLRTGGDFAGIRDVLDSFGDAP
jgi:cell wall-associated NlpC family hydrolase